MASEALPDDEGHSNSRLARTHAMLAAEEGNTVNYKLNCPAWYKPYDEVLLETDLERLLTILAGPEMAGLPTPWGIRC
jgi:hypothetical protein